MLERVGAAQFKPPHWAQLFDALDVGMHRRAELQRRGGGMALRRSGGTSSNLLGLAGLGPSPTGVGGAGGKGLGGKGVGGKGAAAGGKGGKGGKGPVRKPVLLLGNTPWVRSGGGGSRGASAGAAPATAAPTPVPSAPAPAPAGAPAAAGAAAAGASYAEVVLRAAAEAARTMRLEELVKGGLQP